jgi:hypothetical protein
LYNKTVPKKLLPLFSDFYRCFFVRRLHHDKLSTLRAGLAFQLQILRAGLACWLGFPTTNSSENEVVVRKDIF